MDRHNTLRLSFLASLGLGAAGCGLQSPSSPGDQATQAPLPPALQAANVRIENDPAVLASRLVHLSRPLLLVERGGPEPGQVADAAKSERTLGVRLTQVGEVMAPEVDGHVVQANDVDIHGRRAIVAYNFAGDTFAGAVQVIDFTHPGRPELVAEVLYRNADASAVTMDGSHVFVGLASDDPTLGTPALLQEMELTGKGLAATGNWLDLPSWAVTDLAVHGNNVVAAVGARDGGVAVVERNRMLLASFAQDADARGLDVTSHGVMVVTGGGDAHLVDFDVPGLRSGMRARVAGYRQDGAKGTIEVASNRAYLGAGDGGFQVRAADGSLLGELGNEELSDHDARLAVVNAVSVANHLGFVAAGPAGALVVDLGRHRCDGRESETPEDMRVLGELRFEDGASCNMVKSKEDILVVATGRGGVKLVEMDFLR